MNKKGFQALLPIVSVLIIGAMLIGCGLLVLTGMETAAFTSTDGAVLNESITTVTEVGETLAKSTLRDVVCAIPHAVVNNSANPIELTSGNWTQTNCVIASTGTDALYNNSNWNVSYAYTFEASSFASNGTAKSASALYDIANTWLPVIIVVIMAMTVILYVSGAFGASKKK